MIRLNISKVSFKATAIVVVTVFLLLCWSCKAPNPLVEQGPASFAALYAADHGSFREGYFIFNAPGNRDYIAINSDFSKTDDVLIGLDLSDFMQAGFDPQTLKPDDFSPIFFVYDLPTSSMVLSCHISDAAFNHGAYLDSQGKPVETPTPQTLYLELLRNNPAMVSYQAGTKTFSLNFGAGVGLEWPSIPAGSLQAVSFVLDPTPFVKAGLDIKRLQKWKIETVAVNGANGSTTKITRLHLSFNLP